MPVSDAANPAAAALGAAGGGARPALGGYTGPLGPPPVQPVVNPAEPNALALAALESHAAQVRADAEARQRELAPPTPEAPAETGDAGQYGVPGDIPAPGIPAPGSPAPGTTTPIQHVPAHDPIAILLARQAQEAANRGATATAPQAPPAAGGFVTPTAASYIPLADVPVIMPPPSYEDRLDGSDSGAPGPLANRFRRSAKKGERPAKLDKHGNPRKPRPRWVRPAMGCCVALITILVVLRLLTPAAPGPAPTDSVIDPNVTWDERFAEEVAFVEQERNLSFKRPVAIEFLPIGEFRTELFEDQRKRSELDGARGQAATAIADALGYTFANTAGNTAAETGVIYLEMSGRVVAIEGEIDASMRQKIVGQLAAALIDQHFDLSRSFENSSQAQTAASLWAADAGRIQRLWASSQPGSPALEATRSPGLILADQLLTTQAGVDLLDAYLTNPPTTAEFLFDPTQVGTYAKRLSVQAPLLRPGETLIGTDDVGPVAWLAVLNTALDTPSAMRAVYGWGGDAAVAFTRDGVPCTRVAVRGDTTVDEQELEEALKRWVAAAPDQRTLERVGNQLEIGACRPDTVNPANATAITNASVLVTTLVGALEGADVSRENARCVALNTVIGKAAESLDAYVGLNGPQLFEALKPDLVATSASCDVFVDGITPTTAPPPTTAYVVDKKKKSALNPWDPENTTTSKPPRTTTTKATTTTGG
jgi:hypothetical protein